MGTGAFHSENGEIFALNKYTHRTAFDSEFSFHSTHEWAVAFFRSMTRIDADANSVRTVWIENLRIRVTTQQTHSLIQVQSVLSLFTFLASLFCVFNLRRLHFDPVNLREMIDGPGTAAIAIVWIAFVDIFVSLLNVWLTRCSRQLQSPWWSCFTTNRYVLEIRGMVKPSCKI